MKIGYEVEGRFKGLYSLFMTSDEAVSFFQFKSLKQRAFPEGSADTIEKVRHIYVSDTPTSGSQLSPTDKCLRIWNELGLPVTYETNYIRERNKFPPNVHVMLRVDNTGLAFESFWELYDTDQIKFSLDQTVYCVTKENMSVTFPSHFSGDIEFEARTDENFRVNT